MCLFYNGEQEEEKIKQAQEKLELEKSIIEQEKIDFTQDVYITVKEFDLNRKQLKIKKRLM